MSALRYTRCPSQLLQRSVYDSNHKVIANVCRAHCLHALPWNFKWAMTTSPVCVHPLRNNCHASRIQMPDVCWSLHTAQPAAGVHISEAPGIYKQKQQSLSLRSDQIKKDTCFMFLHNRLVTKNKNKTCTATNFRDTLLCSRWSWIKALSCCISKRAR